MHELMDKNAMFYVGQTPWHGLGEKLEIAPNTKEALKLAKLDWEVHKAETAIKIGMHETSHVGIMHRWKVSYHDTGYCCTFRFDEKKQPVILGHVSKKYEVLQNKDAFQPFDEVLLDRGYTYETAGAVKDGQRIWILAKAPDGTYIGDDALDQYVLLFNSHNGSTGVTMKPTAIRVVCNNTLEFALNRDSDSGISLRHTTGVKDRLDTLTSALKSCEEDMEDAFMIMRRMQDADATKEVMDQYFEDVFPSLKYRDVEAYHPVTNRKIPNFAKPQYDKLMGNFYCGAGNNGKSMWDAYNAVTEYVDHNKNYKDPISSIGFGWGKDVKQKAFKIASKYIDS